MTRLLVCSDHERYIEVYDRDGSNVDEIIHFFKVHKGCRVIEPKRWE